MGYYKESFLWCIVPAMVLLVLVAVAIRRGFIFLGWGRKVTKERDRDEFWMVMGLHGLVALVLFGYAVKWAYLWYTAG